MTNSAKEARKAYMKEYRAKNKEKLAEYNKKWQKENADKVRKNQANYWDRKALKG